MENLFTAIRSRVRRATAMSLLSTALLSSPYGAVAGNAPEVVHAIDFTDKPTGPAVDWLRDDGYEFRLDAEALNPRFSDKGLVLSTDVPEAGLFVREVNLPDANRIHITWGVGRYPDGADWDNGTYRVPIAVMVSFGDKQISSGNIFVPNAPYFISLFLSKNAQAGKAYTANYYRKGGRYFCQPCTPADGETVTTEFDLDSAFRNEFGESTVPPITSFSFQMNTEDTRSKARAYIKRIEFLAR